jgi:hypothetical protein
MRTVWVETKEGCNLLGGSAVRAYVVSNAGTAGNDSRRYQARLRTSGRGEVFATLEAARAWCDKELKIEEVECALDGEPLRFVLHYASQATKGLSLLTADDFATVAHLQSLATGRSTHAVEDQDFVDAISLLQQL